MLQCSHTYVYEMMETELTTMQQHVMYMLGRTTCHVICCGPGGSGKSLVVNTYIDKFHETSKLQNVFRVENVYDKEDRESIFNMFSKAVERGVPFTVIYYVGHMTKLHITNLFQVFRRFSRSTDTPDDNRIIIECSSLDDSELTEVETPHLGSNYIYIDRITSMNDGRIVKIPET